MAFLKSGGDVGIFDATNTTRKRRRQIVERCWHADVDILFIESICNDPVLLAKNYEMKLSNSDYADMDPEMARKDFADRIKKYESIYETMDEVIDKDIPYIKLYNVCWRSLSVHRCRSVSISQPIAAMEYWRVTLCFIFSMRISNLARFGCVFMERPILTLRESWEEIQT